jgi:hypothetical protein
LDVRGLEGSLLGRRGEEMLVHPDVVPGLELLRIHKDHREALKNLDITDEAGLVETWTKAVYFLERHCRAAATWMDLNPMGTFFAAMQDGFEVDQDATRPYLPE